MRKFTRLAPLATVACALAIPTTAGAAPTPYQATVIAGGPSLYWPLDESAGPAVSDLSGNAHAGSAAASVVFGKAGAFTYANTSAELPGGATITGEPGSAPAIIELWVRPTARGAQTLATQGDPATTGWQIAINSKKKLVVTTAGKTVDPKVNLPVGAWSMVDIAFKGGNVWFVTNGGLAKSKSLNAHLSGPPAATSTLTLGAGSGAIGRRFDEVALYPTAPASFDDFKTFARTHFNATALPQNTTLPAVVVPGGGAPVDGQTLTVTPGAWNGSPAVPYAYQWLRCDLPSTDDTQSCDYIDGATTSSYTVRPEDLGSYLIVEETATNAAGSSYVDSNDSGKVTPLAPTISGTADEGQTLAANPHTSTGATLTWTYQWQRCASDGTGCADIGGATDAAYTLQPLDAGKTVRVVVSTANVSATSAVTPAITSSGAPVAPPVNAGAPTIDGTPQAGQTLVSTPGLWTGNPAPAFTYQWLRCGTDGTGCAAIDGATGLTYVLTADDVDHTIAVLVTATSTQGSAEAQSDPTAVVVAAPSTDPGTGPGTDPGTGPGTDPGTGPGTGPGTTPGSGTGTGCAVRLARLPKAKVAKVAGLGRVKLSVRRGKAGAGMRLVLKAKKASVGRIRVKIDRRWKKGSKRGLSRAVSLKGLKTGRHVLRFQVKPKSGKAKTLKVVLKVKGC